MMEKEVEEKRDKNEKNNSDLVIEENTIYEIDQDCLSCLERGKTRK